jgi:hypothetical protein
MEQVEEYQIQDVQSTSPSKITITAMTATINTMFPDTSLSVTQING